MNIKDLSDLELMIEVLYEGKSTIVPKAQVLEPIDMDELRIEVNDRYGMRNINVQEMVDYCLGTRSPLSEEDKLTLKGLKDFKERTNSILKKIKSKPDEKY